MENTAPANYRIEAPANYSTDLLNYFAHVLLNVLFLSLSLSSLREKSIKTILVDNYLIYNFSLSNFYRKSNSLANKSIFAFLP